LQSFPALSALGLIAQSPIQLTLFSGTLESILKSHFLRNRGASMRSFLTMKSDEYHAHKAIGSTTLKLGLESFAKLKAKVDGKIKESTADYFELGRCAHSAILEQDFSNYVCGPEAAKNTKEWKTFEALYPDKVVLKESQYEQVRGMHEAFYAHNLAPKIIAEGQPEQSFFVEILGQEYKARPDWLKVESEGREKKDAYIVDYKTCQDLDYEACQRAIGNYGYDISAAHYIQVVSTAASLPITEYYWIFQEKEPPYELAVFRLDDFPKERAIKLVKRLYERIAHANKSKLWPGRYTSQIYDIDLPTYLTQKRSIE
jgi:hypothetical protein